jgi:BatD DUF11 like domain
MKRVARAAEERAGARLALRLSTWLLALLFSTASREAWAQGAPQLEVQLSTKTAGVGDPVYLELSATSADTMPTDPQLGPAKGLVVRGPSASPSQTHININGSRMDRYTLTVTWTLEGRRTGSFRIGPSSVVVGGVRYASLPITLTVVPAGQAPARQPPQAQFPPGMPNPFLFSPFDPWKGLLQGHDPDDRAPPAASPVATDPKLSLDAPRGSAFFLHATADKSAAVVGEQVTFSVYEYFDVDENRPEGYPDARDAAVSDFVRHPILPEQQEPPFAGYASIGGRTWKVMLVRRWALFPLHAGDLTIGPMRVTMLQSGAAAGASRTSEALVVHVSEPPLQGRPAGYGPGDVGHFSLSADVKPRDVEEGGAIGVHVEVSGTGNIPSTIATPARDGVEWLAPEVHEELGSTEHDAFGGKRTFDFVVRLRRAGPMDLGVLSLPFWNPDQRKYEVARTPLGVVRVSGSPAAASASAEAVREILPGLPAPRGALEGSRAPRAHADDSPIFWMAGVGAWPLGFGVAVAGRAAGRRVHQAWRRRRTSPVTELRERLAAATVACDKADARTADAAIARALEAAAVAHAGVNVRGAVGGEVAERLERAGIARDTASRVAGLLRECEAARFAPDTADIIGARERWLRAQGAIRGLEKRG